MARKKPRGFAHSLFFNFGRLMGHAMSRFFSENYRRAIAKEVHQLHLICMVYEYPVELAHLEYQSITKTEGHLTNIEAIQETRRRIFLRLPVSN